MPEPFSTFDPRPQRTASARRRRATAVAARRRMALRAAVLSRRSKRLSRRQRFGAVMVSVAVAGFLLVWGGGTVALALLDSAMGGIPDPKPVFADSQVLDRNGKQIALLHPQGDSRIPVTLDQVAPSLLDATVAIEDKAFWSEGAIDLGRVAGAAWADVAHHDSQGASTITMQLAKIRYLQDDNSFTYKVRQMLIARHLDATMTKRQILQEYVNDIYYGHGATGIEAAAHIFFNTDAKHLDVAQSALLAGLPNHPTDLDPLRHPDAARQRQQQVLEAMVENGAITQAQADQAAAEKLTYATVNPDDVNLAPAFVTRVANDVQRDLHRNPYVDGLRIQTTLDLDMQQYAQKVVTQQVDGIRGYHVSDGAMVSIDPRSGDIVVYVGGAGPGHPGSEIDMAGTGRQPGSTFKLFTYSAALTAKKVTELTPVADTPYRLPTGGPPDGEGPYEVHDYDGSYHGVLPVAEAFANSLNIPAVKVEMATGIANVVKMARNMGVTTLTQPDSSYGASLTLGSYPVPLWEMAQAGGIIANGGQLHPAHVLLSVKDHSGKELLPPQPKPRQALDPGVAYIVNDILTHDQNRWLEFGRGSALTLPDHTVAAKTGTTQDFKDNLTVGWTPHLVTATWVGNTDDSAMRGTTGLTGAAPIWNAFMEHALKNTHDDWPGPPSDVYKGSMGGRTGWFLKGTGPQTQLENQHPGCRTWSYNGGTFWWCGSGDSGMPGDPGGSSGGGGGGGGGGGSVPLPTPKHKPHH